MANCPLRDFRDRKANTVDNLLKAIKLAQVILIIILLAAGGEKRPDLCGRGHSKHLTINPDKEEVAWLRLR